MAMTPYTQTWVGSKKIVEKDGTVWYSPNQLVRQEILSGITSNANGDYHTVNDHTFKVFRKTTLFGVARDLYPDGKSRVISGPNMFNMNETVLLPQQFDENVRAMALVDMFSQLRGSDVDLLVDGVQWRQTLAMVNLWKRGLATMANHALHVLPTARNTQKALDTLNKGNLARDVAARRTREVDASLNWLANRRLEYVYGWKPTMTTMRDLAKLATHPPADAGFTRVEGRGKMINRKVEQLSHLGNPPLVFNIFKSEICRVRCNYAPANDTLEKLSQVSSLNAASLIYEATPYSFVLDWAVGMGDWFRTMETALLHQNNFLGGYQIQSYSWNARVTRKGKTTTGDVDVVGEIQQVQLRRKKLTTSPFPTRPVVNVNLGLDQVLNAAALTKQKVSFIDRLLSFRRK